MDVWLDGWGCAILAGTGNLRTLSLYISFVPTFDFFSNWLLPALNSICLLHLFCFPL